MTIEIRELVFKTTIVEEDSDELEKSVAEIHLDALVEECVRNVIVRLDERSER